MGHVAVLSDVHANVPALRAVLAEPDADRIVFCGATLGADVRLRRTRYDVAEAVRVFTD